VGGGVLIAVNSDFSSELISCLSNIEFFVIKLTVCQTSVYTTCSYIPPQSDLSVYLEHFSNIRLISSKLSYTDYTSFQNRTFYLQSEKKNFFLMDFGPPNTNIALKKFVHGSVFKILFFFRIFEVVLTILNIDC